MVIDLITHSEVAKLIFFNLLKLLVMFYLFFYLLPQYIFPQKYVENTYLDRFVYNVIYMLTAIFSIIPLLIFLKIFSIITLAISFFLLKIFLKYYVENENYLKTLKEKFEKLFIKIFESLDYLYKFLYYGKQYRDYKKLIIIQNVSYYVIIRYFVIFTFIIYAIYAVNLCNFLSLSNKTSDVSQFIEWVAYLHKNILYADNKTGGPDFFGLPIFVFFLQLISNIDSVILFSVYPSIILLLLLTFTYYVIYKITKSHYCAIFSLIIYIFYLLSPVGEYVTGKVHFSMNPPIKDFFGLKVYFAFMNEMTHKRMLELATYPYNRINSGLPYEFSHIFFPVNIYFLIMSFLKKQKRYIIMYALSLFIIFTIHGGQALILIPVSFLIFINALIFKKVNFEIIKKGIPAILIPAILGSSWALSMLKYGLPIGIGKAAPILDKLLKTRGTRVEILTTREIVAFVVCYKIQIFIYFIFLLLYPLTLFVMKKEKKFLCSSIALSFYGVLFMFFAENLGFPRFVSQTRSVEYLFLSLALCAGIYFHLFESLILKIFIRLSKRIFDGVMSVSLLIILIISIFLLPTWNQAKVFYASLNSIQYNAVALDIYKIKKLRRPLSYTIVSFVQGYSKVLGKGFHLNVSTFLEKYDPYDKFLRIPTEYIYIFLEVIPQKYTGSGEWYYRWRKNLEDELKAWINIYSMYHKNIKIFDDRDFLIVYEIDNRNYMRYLYERKKLKHGSSTN